jgi:hypothetical protein
MSEYTDLVQLVTFRPLERPVECSYRSSPFSASWSNTVSLLSKELRAHGASQAVLEIDFREQDLRLDGLPRSDRRARSDGIVLSFKALRVPGHPQLRYEVGTYAKWQDNVRAIALGLESLRAVDRYGITKRGEQYAGWKALSAGAGDGGDPSHGRVLISQAGGVKQALHLAHPDHGGSEKDFRDVIAARDA